MKQNLASKGLCRIIMTKTCKNSSRNMRQKGGKTPILLHFKRQSQ